MRAGSRDALTDAFMVGATGWLATLRERQRLVGRSMRTTWLLVPITCSSAVDCGPRETAPYGFGDTMLSAVVWGRTMRHGILRAISGLKNDQRGAVLVYVALALLPLICVAGVAMDLGHATYAKQKLTNGVDAAALAVGAQRGLTLDESRALAESFVRAHYPDNLKSISVSDTGFQVDVTATADVPTAFMQVFNTPSVEIGVTSRSLRPQGKLEIALVVDQTGSMAGDKLNNLKLAAKELIDTVVWDYQTDDYYAKIAIVPYAVGVNVGAYANSVRGTIASGTCLVPGCLVFQFLNPLGQIKLFGISTCVSERTGAQAFTDAPPTVALVGTNYPVASNPCPSNSILPLTNDKSALKAAIDALQAGGSTAGHIGVAWGWYLLSPSWGYLWPTSQPAPYSDMAILDSRGLPLLRKILILMTDGEYNSAYCQGVISQDSTSGSGSNTDHINCNAPNGQSFNQAESLCTNMKATGFIVYTIGFNIVDDQRARDLMSSCATDASHAYQASTGDELQQAFRDIAAKISALRLTN